MSKDKSLMKTLETLSEMGGVNKPAIREGLLRRINGEEGFAELLYELTNAENENVRARALELIGTYITDEDDREKKLSTMETEDVLATATQLLKEAKLATCPHCGGDLCSAIVGKTLGGVE